MIPFNRPSITGKETAYIAQALTNGKLSGDGPFTKQASKILEQEFSVPKALLTTSCTHALEMMALLLDLGPDDEVIVPSFTFVSTANAFALRGAQIVFVDIEPSTMNLDPVAVSRAMTKKTKAIVPVHYAGVSCDMESLWSLARPNRVRVLEDSAQGYGATYRGKPLGALGEMGALSFHDTKNINCGEGGALLISSSEIAERAEIIREKGTNRSRFLRGQVDKYTWVDIGSSYLPSELNAAFLVAQLDAGREITDNRIATWNRYRDNLKVLEAKGLLELPRVPTDCKSNGHMFWVKLSDLDERSRFISFLGTKEIGAAFHYVPLHTSPMGQKIGIFRGEDKYTTRESERLVRLPLFYGMAKQEVDLVCQVVEDFFRQ